MPACKPGKPGKEEQQIRCIRDCRLPIFVGKVGLPRSSAGGAAVGGSVSSTTSADHSRSRSKGSRKNNKSSIRFNIHNNILLAEGGRYQGPFRRLNSSDLEEPFQPEVLTVPLFGPSPQHEAKHAFGILNSPSLGPPDLASVLSTILQKDPKYCDRATSRPSSKVGPSCRRHPALLVNPAGAPAKRDRISIGQRPRKPIRVERSHANASQI